MNNKLIKYGVLGSLVLGLSSCFMNGNQPPVDYPDGYSQRPHHHHHNGKMYHEGKMYHHGKMDERGVNDARMQKANKAHHASSSSSSSNQVYQKTTPGPKQTAAPQLPVIQ